MEIIPATTGEHVKPCAPCFANTRDWGFARQRRTITTRCPGYLTGNSN